MKWILIFIAINQPPAQLGAYDTLDACRSAIRQIYFRQMAPQGVNLQPENIKAIWAAVDIQVKYDQKYHCQPNK